MVIVFNINKMVVVFNINIKLATVLIRIWKGLRQPADLVGGTRMGTSCHLAYLLHIFTIAGTIIINTRPKPAYGRQGLAGSWGQNIDQAGTFWSVLNVSLCASGAQLG